MRPSHRLRHPFARTTLGVLAAALALSLAGERASAQDGDRTAAPAADLAAAVDRIFVDLDRTSSPGCAVGVVRDGALVFADGYGSANLDHEIPITPQTVFYMASVSKQFTAGAALLAARQGHLSLDDDIREWVPELPDYGAPITVRHLVHHTSGLRDYLTLQSIAGRYGGTTDEEIVALLARQKALNFEPGDRYLYSNSGYFLLSEIVERATGLSLREYADREFFGPLGMRNSHFHDDANHIVRNRATAYAPMEDGWRMEHAWDFAQVGSGGLYSNVVDMARWDAAFEAGEVGDPGFREAMLRPGVLNNGDTLDYAFGLGVREARGQRVIAHGGSLAGFRSYMLRFPDEATSVIALCNATNADPAGRAMRVAELVLGDRLAPEPAGSETTDEATAEPEPVTLSEAELSEYAGRYYSEELDAALELYVADSGLALRSPGRDRPLTPIERDVFDSLGARVRFTRDGEGDVAGFVLDAGRANGLIFERAEP